MRERGEEEKKKGGGRKKKGGGRKHVKCKYLYLLSSAKFHHSKVKKTAISM